jgi:hypothetical protein
MYDHGDLPGTHAIVQKRLAGGLLWHTRCLWIDRDQLLYSKESNWTSALVASRGPKSISLGSGARVLPSTTGRYAAMDDRLLLLRSGVGMVYELRFVSPEACELWTELILAAIDRTAARDDDAGAHRQPPAAVASELAAMEGHRYDQV